MKIIITESQLNNGYDMYIKYLFGKLKKKKYKNDIYWINTDSKTPIIYRNNCYFVDTQIKRELKTFFQMTNDAAWEKILKWLNDNMEYKTECIYGKTDDRI
jgi:hypothetical protein